MFFFLNGKVKRLMATSKQKLAIFKFRVKLYQMFINDCFSNRLQSEVF